MKFDKDARGPSVTPGAFERWTPARENARIPFDVALYAGVVFALAVYVVWCFE